MIWVLTAGFGDGHNTAARSVAEALRLQSPGQRVEVCDLISEAHPLLAGFSQAAYRAVITTFPALWKMAYHGFAKPGVCESAKWIRPLVAALEHKLQNDRPQVIVSTYPLYSSLLAAVRARGVPVPPIVTVITDSITVHPSWTVAPSDLLCVADEDTRESVLRLGVAPEVIHVTGFPVGLAFRQADSAPANERKPAQVLYMPSTSTGHVARTLEELRPLLQKGVHLTLQTGRHSSRLYQAIRRFLDLNPNLQVDVIGWTNRIPELLLSHDILISKAGGAILHEALAARIPAIIDYVVPGQEEGNAELLIHNHCGLRSHSPEETAVHLQRMLDNGLKLAKEMREAMRPLSAPDAAVRVAELALALDR